LYDHHLQTASLSLTRKSKIHTKADSAIAVGVKKLEGCSVESIGHAQTTLESLKLLKRDVPEKRENIILRTEFSWY
jgi:hypothetical protein